MITTSSCRICLIFNINNDICTAYTARSVGLPLELSVLSLSLLVAESPWDGAIFCVCLSLSIPIPFVTLKSKQRGSSPAASIKMSTLQPSCKRLVGSSCAVPPS